MAGILLVGCGDDDEGGAARTSVQVTLDEWSVATDPASAPAGEITFEVANAGEETHEFVVIRTDLGVLNLPTADDGSVDEEGEGVEVVGEVEDVPAGASEPLTLDLDAGRYVLICNIFEEEMMMEMPDPSHYQSGMRTEFTVE
jgi:uncharacterized cupredoxin-like copper-binding protein